MKKVVLFSAAVLIAIVLCACADVTVSYRLSGDNTVNVDYRLVLSPSGENAADQNVTTYIDAIKNYWEQLGFLADYTAENDVYTLSGNKTVTSDSRGGAAAQLSSILTDENSLFYDAVFTYTPSYFEDNYSFTAKVSLENIIRKSEDRTIPAAEVQSFLTGAKSGKYRLSLSLPGEVISTNADERDGQNCTWILKYGEAKEIEITTKQAFAENAVHYAGLNETKSRDDMMFTICGAAAGGIAVIIITIVLVRRTLKVKSRR